MEKHCRDCGELKPLTDFSPSSKNTDGRVSYCRDCFRIRHREYRDRKAGGPPERRSAARASSVDVKWCPGCGQERARQEFGSNVAARDGLTSYCSPCHNAITRANVIKNHGSTRDFHLRRRYGIDSTDVERLVAEQDGVCALCRHRPPQHVDHDHLTGSVRGILCSTCNQGLGNFADDGARLRLAAAYVERHSWQRVQEAPGVVRLVAPRTPRTDTPQTDRPQADGPEEERDLDSLVRLGRDRAAAPQRSALRPSAVTRRRRR